jgi:hypothetical protein
MLLLKVRERDIIGNTILENMVATEKKLEELCEGGSEWTAYFILKNYSLENRTLLQALY